MEIIESFRQTAEHADRIMRACQKIQEGITELSSLMAMAAPVSGPDRSLKSLTPQQTVIYELMSQGLAVPEIAKRIKVSPRTVDAHRNSIRLTLKFPTMAGLIEFAKLHPKGLTT